jgi:hypothetical protein
VNWFAFDPKENVQDATHRFELFWQFLLMGLEDLIEELESDLL